MVNPPKNDEFVVLSASTSFDPAADYDYKNITQTTKMPAVDHPQREVIRQKLEQFHGKKVYSTHEVGSARNNSAQVIFDAIQSGEAIVR